MEISLYARDKDNLINEFKLEIKAITIIELESENYTFDEASKRKLINEVYKIFYSIIIPNYRKYNHK